MEKKCVHCRLDHKWSSLAENQCTSDWNNPLPCSEVGCKTLLPSFNATRSHAKDHNIEKKVFRRLVTSTARARVLGYLNYEHNKKKKLNKKAMRTSKEPVYHKSKIAMVGSSYKKKEKKSDVINPM
jgi:hypothetical protein